MNPIDALGYYFGQLRIAQQRAGGILWGMGSMFLALPFVVRAVLDPWEVLRLRRLVGHSETWAVWQGELVALVTLALVLSTLHVALLSFYRRTRGMIPLWPLVAAIGAGGGALWWFYCGSFDFAGLVASCLPIAVMNFLEQRAMARVFGSQNALQPFDGDDAMFGE